MNKINDWMIERFGEWPWHLTQTIVGEMIKEFPIFQINRYRVSGVPDFLTKLPNDVYYYDYITNLVIFESHEYAVEFKLLFGDDHKQLMPGGE